MSKPIATECRKGGSGECDGFGSTGSPCWCPCHEFGDDPRAPQTIAEFKAWHDRYHANRTVPLRRARSSTWKGLLP